MHVSKSSLAHGKLATNSTELEERVYRTSTPPRPHTTGANRTNPRKCNLAQDQRKARDAAARRIASYPHCDKSCHILFDRPRITRALRLNLANLANGCCGCRGAMPEEDAVEDDDDGVRGPSASGGHAAGHTAP